MSLFAGMFVIIPVEGITRFSSTKRPESLPVDFRLLNCVLRFLLHRLWLTKC